MWHQKSRLALRIATHPTTAAAVLLPAEAAALPAELLPLQSTTSHAAQWKDGWQHRAVRAVVIHCHCMYRLLRRGGCCADACLHHVAAAHRQRAPALMLPLERPPPPCRRYSAAAQALLDGGADPWSLNYAGGWRCRPLRHTAGLATYASNVCAFGSGLLVACLPAFGRVGQQSEVPLHPCVVPTPLQASRPLLSPPTAATRACSSCL